MATVKTETKKIGGNLELDSITSYITSEDWDYTRRGTGNGNYLEVEIFEGTLRLNSDGTWMYAE